MTDVEKALKRLDGNKGETKTAAFPFEMKAVEAEERERSADAQSSTFSA